MFNSVILVVDPHVYIFQNLSSAQLKRMYFIICKLHLNNIDEKTKL